MSFFKPNIFKILLATGLFVGGFLLLYGSFIFGKFAPTNIVAIPMGILSAIVIGIPVYLSTLIPITSLAPKARFISAVSILAFFQIFWSYFLALIIYFAYQKIKLKKAAHHTTAR